MFRFAQYDSGSIRGRDAEQITPAATAKPLKIISGGQTGVDRAALDVALGHGIECGGWCPAGRLDEFGKIPDHYPLQELQSGGFNERTLQNVKDSDGTVVIYPENFAAAPSRPFASVLT